MSVREELGKSIAAGMYYENKAKEIGEGLVENIVSNFNMLTNLNPGLAFNVLQSLGEQITEEEVDKLIESRQTNIEDLGSKIAPGLHLED